MESKISEKTMREVYFKAFGKEYDSSDRKQTPLPLEIAYRVALNRLKRDKKYEFGGEITEDIYYKSVNDFVFFCLNFPSNFFNIFGGFEQHFANKFKAYYNSYGSYGAMIKLYIELDSDNRRLLTNFAYDYDGSFSKSNVSEVEYYNSVNHFVFFCFNFPNNFMEAFPIHLRVHLSEKWSDAYRKKGSIGAMIYFWSLLSDDNRKKLADWVKNNYTGTRLYELGGALGDVAGMLPSPLPMSTIQPMAKGGRVGYYNNLRDLLELRDNGTKTITLNGFRESIEYVIGLKLDDAELIKIEDGVYETTYANGGQLEIFADGGNIEVGDVVEVKEPNYGRDREYYVVADEVGYDKDGFLISDTKKREQGVFEEEQLEKLYADGGGVDDSVLKDFKTYAWKSKEDVLNDNYEVYFDEEITEKEVVKLYQERMKSGYDFAVQIYEKGKDGKQIYISDSFRKTWKEYDEEQGFFANGGDTTIRAIGYKDGGLAGLVDEEQMRDISFNIKVKSMPKKDGVILHEKVTIEEYEARGEKNIKLPTFHLIYGDSSLAIFDAFNLDEIAGLKREDAVKFINDLKAKGKTERDGSFMAGLTNFAKDEIFMFFNVERLNFKGFANRVLPHEALHLTRYLITLYKNEWIANNLNTPNWWEDKRAIFVDMNDDNEEFFAETLERISAIAIDGWFRATGQKLFENGGDVVGKYYIFDGYDSLNNKPLYRVHSSENNENEYVGEWHKDKKDAIKELNNLLGNAGAGEMIDLFEDYENIPANVQEVLNRYSEDFGEDFGLMDYQDMAKMHDEIYSLGYTFDSGLDNQPMGLRPIGVELNQLRGYEEYGLGGFLLGAGVGALGYKLYLDTKTEKGKQKMKKAYNKIKKKVGLR